MTRNVPTRCAPFCLQKNDALFTMIDVYVDVKQIPMDEVTPDSNTSKPRQWCCYLCRSLFVTCTESVKHETLCRGLSVVGVYDMSKLFPPLPVQYLQLILPRFQRRPDLNQVSLGGKVKKPETVSGQASSSIIIVST